MKRRAKVAASSSAKFQKWFIAFLAVILITSAFSLWGNQGDRTDGSKISLLPPSDWGFSSEVRTLHVEAENGGKDIATPAGRNTRIWFIGIWTPPDPKKLK